MAFSERLEAKTERSHAALLTRGHSASRISALYRPFTSQVQALVTADKTSSRKLEELMKKLTLTALFTAAALSTMAFAAPSSGHSHKPDYTADQTFDWQYTGGPSGLIIAPHRLWGTKESDPAMQAEYAAHARISPEEAAQKAFGMAPGEVKSVRLGVDKGVLVYEIVVGNTEVMVSASNGAQWGQHRSGWQCSRRTGGVQRG